MDFQFIIDKITSHHKFKDIIQSGLFQKNETIHLLISGLAGSEKNIILGALLSKISYQEPTTVVYVLEKPDEAEYVFSDLQALLYSQQLKSINVLFFPDKRKKNKDASLDILRTEVLTTLAQKTDNSNIIVTSTEAITSFIPSVENLLQYSMTIHQGDTITHSRLIEKLLQNNFSQVDFVYEPGQFSVRGCIMDIFSFAYPNPYRIFWGPTNIETIKEFDIENQLSIKPVTDINIVAMPTNADQENNLSHCTLLDILPKDTLFVSNDLITTLYQIQNIGLSPELSQQITFSSTIEFSTKSWFENPIKIVFHSLPQPSYNKNIPLLIADLQSKVSDGYSLAVMSEQPKQLDRIDAIFKENENIPFTRINGILHEGFVDQDLKLICYSDHQIFERFHRVSFVSDNVRRGKALLTIKEINQLQKGDYVVHQDHGIGQFDGLVTTMINGLPQERIKILYRNGDAIYVSIHNLQRISKFKSKEGDKPTIAKIGSSAWEKIKERTKDKIKHIARELILLYAQRKKQKGFAFTPDGYLQQQLEASFIYEDTPDQYQASADVKKDMERDTPMDRLICGDVGFGKTEIAIRAAFKAVTDSKQVAVLVPTTVLALQHFYTFRHRLKDLPVNIEYISRAKTPLQLKNIKQQLLAGKIDILIGTHRIVNKDIVWKDLGLLIIDEEQKFGVAIKEKIKSYKPNIDVLTLSATPIPRTLQFSLLGARDLSIINTPPPNRYPVATEMITLDDKDLIKEAIENEMNRNGQIFAVCNRIEMLPRIEQQIKQLCPQVRLVIAHGQMPPLETERKIEDFINYDYDILLSTTIIESGIDIPNVNTIFIYSAQQYGLADLHQLRGRVGRANRKAYCYLITPDRTLLSSDAKKRLDALITFSDLGSGFNLSMQDLDIRGAGNLLGPEQSGFIEEMGYDTYQKILNEAVIEIKNELTEENHSQQPSHNPSTNTHQGDWVADCTIECDLPLSLPYDYVENETERLQLYKELSEIKNETALNNFIYNLTDRFGPLPEHAYELLNIVKLRWIARQLGVSKLLLKKEQLTLYLVTDSKAYWQSETFGKIIRYVYNHQDRCHIVEDTNKKGEKTGNRYIAIKQVRTVTGALNLLNKIVSTNSI